MKRNTLTVLAALASLTALLSACEKQTDKQADKPAPAIASPVCADLPNVTDPAQRADLAKKCPRNGAAFQPSPKKSY